MIKIQATEVSEGEGFSGAPPFAARAISKSLNLDWPARVASFVWD